MARPIVVVTGANSGIGFGVCQRLLFQLCHTAPPDAFPQSFAVKGDPGQLVAYDGLTLVMACRSVKRAEAARTQLYECLDTYIHKLGKKPGYDGHANEFRKNVVIDIIPLDLAATATVYEFTGKLTTKYPYVSHLILNAGVGSFCAIDWIGAFKQLIVEPVNGVTAPKYYTQHSGEISIDGLGWVWQSNLFGHYVLYRSLEHLLHASPPPLGSRVIWSSSIEASPDYFDPDDWQNKKSAHSYESTKYQIDLISTRLDQLALQKPACQRIRHLLSHPGVCSTNVANALIGPVLNLCKLFAFYLVRLLGSPNHPIDPLKGAVAAVHLSLAPLAFITLFYQNLNDSPRPSKFGAESDWWGNERVGVMDVKKWGENEKESDILLSKLDALYQAFSPANGVPPKSGIASELM